MKKYIILAIEVIVAILLTVLVGFGDLFGDADQYLLQFIVIYWGLICCIINVFLLKKDNNYIVRLVLFIVIALNLIVPMGLAVAFLVSNQVYQLLFGLLILLVTIGFVVLFLLTTFKKGIKKNELVFILYFVAYIIILNIQWFWFTHLISSPT